MHVVPNSCEIPFHPVFFSLWAQRYLLGLGSWHPCGEERAESPAWMWEFVRVDGRGAQSGKYETTWTLKQLILGSFLLSSLCLSSLLLVLGDFLFSYFFFSSRVNIWSQDSEKMVYQVTISFGGSEDWNRMLFSRGIKLQVLNKNLSDHKSLSISS